MNKLNSSFLWCFVHVTTWRWGPRTRRLCHPPIYSSISTKGNCKHFREWYLLPLNTVWSTVTDIFGNIAACIFIRIFPSFINRLFFLVLLLYSIRCQFLSELWSWNAKFWKIFQINVRNCLLLKDFLIQKLYVMTFKLFTLTHCFILPHSVYLR